MDEFITRHRDVIHGVLEGFDRLLFRGTLRSLSHSAGLGKHMNYHGVLLKDFDGWAQRCTRRLRDHIEGVAQKAGVRCEYLPSAAINKEQRAMAIAEQEGITEGLVCVLSCVEPCTSAAIHRDRQSRRLDLRFVPRKCKFYYLYLIDPTFGWMHIRIQTWLPFDVQVYINGRTHLQRQLDRAGIAYRKADNCFQAGKRWQGKGVRKQGKGVRNLFGENWRKGGGEKVTGTILSHRAHPRSPIRQPHTRQLSNRPARAHVTFVRAPPFPPR